MTFLANYHADDDQPSALNVNDPTAWDAQTIGHEVRTPQHPHDASKPLPLKRDTFVKWSEILVKQAAESAYHRALDETTRITREREERENFRANKRNLNRMLTLLGALLIGLCVTFLLSHPVILQHAVGVKPQTASMLAPYSFVITVMLDTGLALYGYIRKY